MQLFFPDNAARSSNVLIGKRSANMTTFTKLSDEETPTISIHASRRLSKINPNIYSGFTE